MQHYFKDKKILIAITGSIAAYKSLELISQLKKLGAEVRVIMTKSATEFITPLSFATISGHEVLSDTFTHPLAHIEWAKWPELILIAPASANFMAKYAHGFADDLLTTTLLATTSKVVIAPAMNQAMWSHPAVQENLQILKNRGVDIIGPDAGLQACGDIGLGRMTEVEDILKTLPKYFQPQVLKGKKVLITAGPTQEALDPVRYLSNYSSGKMGYALAQSCYYHGATVTLISGPSALKPPIGCNFIAVESAKEMHQQVLTHTANMDIVIASAAVCDFKPETYQAQKIKKVRDTHTLNLTLNQDILASLGALKNKPLLVGFAAETENLLQHAQKKLITKNLDWIIANRVGKDLAFNQDEQEVVLINHQQTKHLAKANKAVLADQIIKQLTHNVILGTPQSGVAEDPVFNSVA